MLTAKAAPIWYNNFQVTTTFMSQGLADFDRAKELWNTKVEGNTLVWKHLTDFSKSSRASWSWIAWRNTSPGQENTSRRVSNVKRFFVNVSSIFLLLKKRQHNFHKLAEIWHCACFQGYLSALFEFLHLEKISINKGFLSLSKIDSFLPFFWQTS